MLTGWEHEVRQETTGGAHQANQTHWGKGTFTETQRELEHRGCGAQRALTVTTEVRGHSLLDFGSQERLNHSELLAQYC